MTNKNIKTIILKSIIAYIFVLSVVVLSSKFATGGGRGRITKPYSISWEEVWHRLPGYMIISVGISYPFFYIFYKEAKDKEGKNK